MKRGTRAIRRSRSRLPRMLPQLGLLLGALAAGTGYFATRPAPLPDRYHEVELTVTGMYCALW